MYKIAKITFKPRITDKDSIFYSLDNVLSLLFKNGQILDYIVEDHDTYFVANVTTTDDDSLDEKYFNEYIKTELQNFSIDVQICCNDALATDSCHCHEHSHYIIAALPEFSSSPIRCGDCGKEVPLTRIPYLFNEQEHYKILNYQRAYKNVDDLFMYGLSDRFTKRQLMNPNSELNKVGLEIREELEKKVNKPVYLFLDHFYGATDSIDCCPKCGKSLIKINSGFIDLICDCCKFGFKKYNKKQNK